MLFESRMYWWPPFGLPTCDPTLPDSPSIRPLRVSFVAVLSLEFALLDPPLIFENLLLDLRMSGVMRDIAMVMASFL